MLKKFANIVLSLLVFIAIVSVYAWDSIAPLVSQVNKTETIDLAALVNTILSYFKYADAWNLIFGGLFISVSLIGLVSIYLLLNWVIKRICIKNTSLRWLESQWFKPLQVVVSSVTVFIFFIAISNLFVVIIANNSTVKDVSEIEEPRPVLLLGTAKMLSTGKGENLYYSYRIEKALEAWNKGKVKYFIISGDKNDSTDYDETRDMTLDLIAGGVPAERIEVDTAGYRTLDSMLRLREEFKYNDVLIISQAFHTPRALTLAWFYGIDALALPAKGTSNMAMVKREVVGAKPKVVLDLFLLNTMPKLESSKYKDYRESFELSDNASVLVMISLGFGGFFVFWAFTSILENRTKGIYYKLALGTVSICLCILWVIGVYETTNIQFIDNAIESISDNTGIGREAVMEKKQKQKKVQLLHASIASAEKNEIERLSSVNDLVEEIISEDKPENLRNDLDSIASTQIPNKLIVATEGSKKAKSTIKFVADIKKAPDSPEPTNEENEKVDTKSAKPNLKDDNKKSSLLVGSSSSVPLSSSNKTESKIRYIKAKVNFTQELKDDELVEFRLDEDLQLGNTTIRKNKRFSTKANVFDGRVYFNIDKIGFNKVDTEVLHNDYSKGIPLNSLSKDKKTHILSEGTVVLLAIKE